MTVFEIMVAVFLFCLVVVCAFCVIVLNDVTNDLENLDVTFEDMDADLNTRLDDIETELEMLADALDDIDEMIGDIDDDFEYCPLLTIDDIDLEDIEPTPKRVKKKK